MRPHAAAWQLPDFDFTCVLGEGSYGTVRLAVHKPTAEFYAVKCLRKCDNLRPARVRTLLNEAHLLVSVSHPFIIRLYQTFQDEDYLYMVMELAPGGELWSLLQTHGKFRPPVAQFYAAEVATALDYLHAQRIIFSDLKPENVMLDAAGHVKLVDFGFAISMDEPSTAIRGTPEYLAPETVESDGKDHTKMVDWWALGCMIFEMLVGQPPFTDDFFPDKRAVFDKIRVGAVEFPWRTVNKVGQSVIRALMHRDPSQRLGVGGLAQVKQHPWFEGVAWDLLLKRKVPAPCLAKQSPMVSPDATAERDKARGKPPVKLDPQQQELFKDFGSVAPEAGARAPLRGLARYKPWIRSTHPADDQDVMSGYHAGDIFQTKAHSH
eukprot:EG_transcript_16092